MAKRLSSVGYLLWFIVIVLSLLHCVDTILDDWKVIWPEKKIQKFCSEQVDDENREERLNKV